PEECDVTNPDNAQFTQMPTPATALQRLEKLVGAWDIRGRTPNAQEDDIRGRVIVEWLPGGHLLQQRGEMELGDTKIRSLEIVCYDPAKDIFPSYVYSDIESVPLPYFWDVRGDAVTHWTGGWQYTGAFSADGR